MQAVYPSWDDMRQMSFDAVLEAAALRAGPALSFQGSTAPDAPVTTLTWAQLMPQVFQAANAFVQLGQGGGQERPVIALILPSGVDIVVSVLAAMLGGVVLPVNPVLKPHQIAILLRQAGAQIAVVPTLDGPLGQQLRKAFEHSELRHVLTLQGGGDPDRATSYRVDNFDEYLAPIRTDWQGAPSASPDVLRAYFHTGGTTGMPKLAQHRSLGILYNAWLGQYFFPSDAVVLCPLPLFHVFGVYTTLMSLVMGGGHLVLPTPDGYRGAGVVDRLWHLVQRHKVTDLMIVPTALAALPQVDADISSLQRVFSGSAPLTVVQHQHFHALTGLEVTEGYGMTECTCVVALNPVAGPKKPGSVGVPMPQCDVRIMTSDSAGVWQDVALGESGEVCVASPGVTPGGVYKAADANQGVFVADVYLRTGDVGRLDEDGYLWLIGRAKDLIIRGGHNIDPAVIEEVLYRHPDVAYAAAIGQPDVRAGELPAAYVQLRPQAQVTIAQLMAHCDALIPERAAMPKYIEIMDEIPRTAVGKLRKTLLREMAIRRIYNAALAQAGLDVWVGDVIDTPTHGPTAYLEADEPRPEDAVIAKVLGGFIRPWAWRVQPATGCRCPSRWSRGHH